MSPHATACTGSAGRPKSLDVRAPRSGAGVPVMRGILPRHGRGRLPFPAEPLVRPDERLRHPAVRFRAETSTISTWPASPPRFPKPANVRDRKSVVEGKSGDVAGLRVSVSYTQRVL